MESRQAPVTGSSMIKPDGLRESDALRDDFNSIIFSLGPVGRSPYLSLWLRKRDSFEYFFLLVQNL